MAVGGGGSVLAAACDNNMIKIWHKGSKDSKCSSHSLNKPLFIPFGDEWQVPKLHCLKRKAAFVGGLAFNSQGELVIFHSRGITSVNRL